MPERYLNLTTELHALAKEALGLPWIGSVTSSDVRFGFDGDTLLANWIESKLLYGLAPESFEALLRRLLAADRMTASEEASEISSALAAACIKRAGTGDSAQRVASIFLRRHISPAGAGRTLLDVGNEFGLTRERVRQICARLEDFLEDASVATPALDRALQAASNVAPSTVDDVDTQFERFIGDGAGIESLIAWAHTLHLPKVPVVCNRVKTTMQGKPVEVLMVQRPGSSAWVETMVRHLTRDMSMLGCTNVLRVAGLMALHEGFCTDRATMEMTLEQIAGFRWLDRETGWFTAGDASKSALAIRVRKMMEVAQEPIGADQITAAVASDDDMIYRDTKSIGLATPPVHVIRELLLGWPWLSAIQHSRFSAVPESSTQGSLSDIEAAIVRVIEQHDGVACRLEMKSVTVGEMGFSDMLLSKALGASPIIERIEHALYKLRGRRIGDNALAAARARLRALTANIHHPGSVPLDGIPTFFVRISESSLRHEQYMVPAAVRQRLAMGRYPALDAKGETLGEIRVGQAGRLYGINRLVTGLVPGDTVQVELANGQLRLSRLPRP